MNYIRGKSVVILEHKTKFLFTVCIETSGKVYYIPIGGGIEFGEHSSEAGKREALEEIGQEVINLQLLNVSENILKYNEVDEHEIVFIYKAEFKNKNANVHSLVATVMTKATQ